MLIAPQPEGDVPGRAGSDAQCGAERSVLAKKAARQVESGRLCRHPAQTAVEEFVPGIVRAIDGTALIVRDGNDAVRVKPPVSQGEAEAVASIAGVERLLIGAQ